jgi:hypothetical protein
MRTCTTVADCAVVTLRKNCCELLVTGVSKAFEAPAETCARDQANEAPTCDCFAQGGTEADDGSTSLGSAGQATPTVSCSSAGICVTSFRSPHPFACGPYECNSGTQICHVVNGHLPGQAATYSCDAVEGTPSCSGTRVPVASCGCAQSANGEVTITECPP